VPKELVNSNIDKQQKEALERSDAAFASAEEILQNVTGSARTSTELERQTARAAWITLIFSQWGHSQQAMIAGDADKARDFGQRAQETVKSAAGVDGIVFPALPGNLRASIPVAAAAAAPTTALLQPSPPRPLRSPRRSRGRNKLDFPLRCDANGEAVDLYSVRNGFVGAGDSSLSDGIRDRPIGRDSIQVDSSQTSSAEPRCTQLGCNSSRE